MMVVALVLLLIALGFVLYRDRDFWFPGTEQAQGEDQQEDQQEAQPVAASASTTTSSVATQPASTARSKGRVSKRQPTSSTPSNYAAAVALAAPVPAKNSAAPVTAIRTVLPPLEVEVVAGDVHKTVHPGTNSVRVDLQQSSAPQKESAPPAAATRSTDSTASVTSNAAERVQMSADTAEVVSSPVRPSYPLLARQMKVQGSVILQALIGRDGLIQDLHVLSGPPILAGAAEEAVRQWHFKPHHQGADTVETQARITVNFTISTN
jgi:protein TonB